MIEIAVAHYLNYDGRYINAGRKAGGSNTIIPPRESSTASSAFSAPPPPRPADALPATDNLQLHPGFSDFERSGLVASCPPGHPLRSSGLRVWRQTTYFRRGARQQHGYAAACCSRYLCYQVATSKYPVGLLVVNIIGLVTGKASGEPTEIQAAVMS